MADILIRGMEMPVQCASCPFWDLVGIGNGKYEDWCRIGNTTVDPWSKPELCPLIDVTVNSDLPKLTAPHDDSVWADVMLDLDAAETLCCQTETLPDIFPTRVIRTICKVLYRHLLREAKQMRKGRSNNA